jgi:hypothetical protein
MLSRIEGITWPSPTCTPGEAQEGWELMPPGLDLPPESKYQESSAEYDEGDLHQGRVRSRYRTVEAEDPVGDQIVQDAEEAHRDQRAIDDRTSSLARCAARTLTVRHRQTAFDV